MKGIPTALFVVLALSCSWNASPSFAGCQDLDEGVAKASTQDGDEFLAWSDFLGGLDPAAMSMPSLFDRLQILSDASRPESLDNLTKSQIMALSVISIKSPSEKVRNAALALLNEEHSRVIGSPVKKTAAEQREAARIAALEKDIAILEGNAALHDLVPAYFKPRQVSLGTDYTVTMPRSTLSVVQQTYRTFWIEDEGIWFGHKREIDTIYDASRDRLRALKDLLSPSWLTSKSRRIESMSDDQKEGLILIALHDPDLAIRKWMKKILTASGVPVT